MELKIDRLTKQFGNKIAVDCMEVNLESGVYGYLDLMGQEKQL